MSTMSIPALDTSIQTTHVWLREIETKMGWRNRQKAYKALRAVLHALRDRLTPAEAADLAAQLPIVVRGIFYEGWRPGAKPLKERTREKFVSHVERELGGDVRMDADKVVQCVLRVLSRHVSGGEVADIKASMPHRLRGLWD